MRALRAQHMLIVPSGGDGFEQQVETLSEIVVYPFDMSMDWKDEVVVQLLSYKT